MEDPLGYAGRPVVVSGGASGMGAAAVRILVELGAQVTVLDRNPSTAKGIKDYRQVDLCDQQSIAAAADSLEGPIGSLFSCAGVAAGGALNNVDVITINFIGGRNFIERLVPKLTPDAGIACIASTGALGWQRRYADLRPLVEMDDFDASRKWCEENPEIVGAHAYGFSKQALNAWAAWRSASLIEQGIRLNTINPAPTDTPLMVDFIEHDTREVIERAYGPIGRMGTPEEQAWAIVLLNSPRLGFVTGVDMPTDGGFMAAILTGQHPGFAGA